ncbi:4Fe-4S binding protein [Desulfitobacterium sp. PCE1]|uniref:4Fe-4S binding protein n=1 Tax=Desulfitobacterium sp. PCE1 TaxID=146907 RepID=UPI00037827D9|nr:4Fe-4S binding protein [Desulfitobacterium sp. PCE1]
MSGCHYSDRDKKKRKHFWLRLSTYILGIFLFYAPFAVFVRVVKSITNNPSTSDIHSFCMRMPINWLFDPTEWYRIVADPLYLSFIIVIAIAFFFGPLFCGWLCSAGALTEYLSKLVPDRFKIDLSRTVNPTPIRYGFLAGFILTPFLGGSVCCAFCNFSIFQRFISGLTGDLQALAYWSTTAIITVVIWFVFFGLFIKGGRGWCSFGCPIGTIQSLFYAIGSKLGFTYKLKYDSSKCNGCGSCIKACSMWSITKTDQGKGISVSPYSCNVCLDCVAVCPQEALSYSKGITETHKPIQLEGTTSSAVANRG